MGYYSDTSASNEIANYMHWHWMLDNQFRSLHRLHSDIDQKLKIINGLASNIESEKTSVTRINFIKKMLDEVRGLLDELSLFEKKEGDMLLLMSVPFAKINIETNESFESEVEYLLTMLRMFYQKTLRMTPLPNKKEAKELSRCLMLTIQPIENHMDRIEKEWYPAILEWLQ
ncbi:hypothetical protein [Paenibacillus sp. Soil724D2]|uniref:hypothetical protein n=1 Tax=Paenibacillus sp. (strain Soil724D2) TaxID=1736392 RepID=UPI000712D29E|nr:hypothetical protein [Paenibacillus sp. Soil724D2]KRE49765.1 hypothetical protein ASG85_23085 [Paenibacillus sp. Soil724D2]